MGLAPALLAPALLRRLRRDDAGSMAIETAIIAPVLLALSLGGYEVGSIVARQTELQSAVAEAAAIVRASAPEDANARTTIRDILMVSAGLTSDQVSVTEIYRCGTNTSYVTTADSCGSARENTYIRVTVSDTYHPMWTEFGLGSSVDFAVTRTIQVG